MFKFHDKSNLSQAILRIFPILLQWNREAYKILKQEVYNCDTRSNKHLLVLQYYSPELESEDKKDKDDKR